MDKPKSKKKPIAKRPQTIPKKSPTKKSKSTAIKVKSPASSPESENDDGDEDDVSKHSIKNRPKSQAAPRFWTNASNRPKSIREKERVETMTSNECDPPKPALPKKIKKDIKDELLESKDVNDTPTLSPFD